MKLNSKKTKLMLFNTARNSDFMPEVRLENETLEVVENMKLLGITISSDLKWHAHISEVCKRGMSKLWMLRRLKKMGANQKILLDLYKKQIRSLLEYAAPVWHSGLTKTDVSEIERVQKCAVAIIFSNQPYKSVVKKNHLEPLEQRRDQLCLKFAVKSSKQPQFSQWFNPKTKNINTRSKKPFHDVPFKTNRWRDSPIPYMTNLLNQGGK